MNVLVLRNAAAGSVDASRQGREALRIGEALAAAGVKSEVRSVAGPELGAAARSAAGSGVDAVVAAGGDGTLGAVGGALAGTGKPLGVLPMGTLNHFARDMGLPMELGPAAAVIAGGVVRAVDVGEVNGRVFLNNSSIGLYPRIVRHRDDQRERLGRGKWLAMVYAFLVALRRFPVVEVRLEPQGVAGDGDGADDSGGQAFHRTTPFVFVGNNQYDLKLLTLGERRTLDAGRLCLYSTRRTGRFGLLRLAVRALFNRLDQDRDFDSLCLTGVRIETPKHRLSVSADGEVVYLEPPLHYRIRPGALRVLSAQ